MNRLTTLMLAATSALMLAKSACKKENESIQPENSTPVFVEKNLMMTAFEVSPAVDLDGDGEADSDLLSFLRPCDRDNTILFEKMAECRAATVTCPTATPQ